MAETVAVMVPRETVNDESVKLLQFFVADGDRVEAGQLIAEVETSKAVMSLESPRAGFVRLMAKPGTEIPIGHALCSVGDTADTAVVMTPAPVDAPDTRMLAAHSQSNGNDAGAHGPAVRFTPLARRLAEEHGLSLADFPGIRVVRTRDITERLRGPESRASETAAPTPRTSAAPVAGVGVSWTDLPRRKQVEIRQIGAGMASVLPSSATSTVLTRGLKAATAAYSGDVSSTAVIVFEVSRLLRKYPSFNAIYRDGRAGLYDEVNIGIAIDDGSGLMVPVIRSADRKSIHEIGAEIRQLIERYLGGTLSVQDFVGGTFTVSDLSSEGVFSFAPLISQGQSAILGIGAEFFVPGSDTGLFNLTLAFDHQLSDGRLAARFLQDLSARIQAYEASVASRAAAERFCAFCSRDAGTIKSIGGFLLRSEVPEGFVCSVCLGGF